MLLEKKTGDKIFTEISDNNLTVDRERVYVSQDSLKAFLEKRKGECAAPTCYPCEVLLGLLK